MKKLIASLVLLMGLSLNVNATPAFVTPAGSFFLIGAAFNELHSVEYLPCNNELITVKHSDGKSNYLFDVTRCELDASPSAYTVK